MDRRHGFTLIEMLAATTVFLVGFVAVYGLFLTGVRFRRLSEGATRSAIAASSILEEIRIKAPHFSTALPADYDGDGDPETPEQRLEVFHPYADQPGVYYRVTGTDTTQADGGSVASVDPGGFSDAIKLRLQIVSLGAVLGEPIEKRGVVRRLGRDTSDIDQEIRALVDGRLIAEYPAVIYRR